MYTYFNMIQKQADGVLRISLNNKNVFSLTTEAFRRDTLQ